MRAQIRGLNQATENIQDGISFVQIGEGGMQEVHDILQRIRELSVKAANDTNAPPSNPRSTHSARKSTKSPIKPPSTSTICSAAELQARWASETAVRDP